ncbi:oxygen-dependent protoporphyrinogen oxidase [Nocardioides scoriae]|uniref:Coproporphyrinogen III oxidase n=1 Tax=Nocardioides scoriae TaxID=642780 RepID=A0A1H1MQ92_9ACTN|nr:oxygen-dependent protoporphyrinogen oxidase [Nocardioides scoriae]
MVGAGIAGLAAARRVVATRPDAEVVVLEAAPRVGGSLHRAEVGGVLVDVGAEAMLHRRPEGVRLAREVGLGDALVHPATTSAQLWNRDRLVPMPRTLMGVPTDLRSLEGVISARGIARAALDAVLPATDLGGEDVSVGRLVEERLGAEVVDRLVEPLLGGVYAGHSREISARAAVPQVVALLERDRALSRAAGAALPPVGEPVTAPVFAGLRGGMARLPAALAASLADSGVQVRTGATVRDLARRPGGGWNLVVGPTVEAEVLRADAVVLATPARSTARLLSDVAPLAALELARVEHASMAIVTLAVPAATFPAVAGSGFLVPPVDGHAIKASTFSFAKWDWVREAGVGAGAGEDLLLLRCSLGRHREEQALQRSDEELVALALADLSQAVGAAVVPVDTHVQRWGGALPQYAVGHLDRVAAVRREVAALPGLAVCGSAYDGVGIPACIASADLAVVQALRGLDTMAP